MSIEEGASASSRMARSGQPVSAFAAADDGVRGSEMMRDLGNVVSSFWAAYSIYFLLYSSW